MTNIELPAKLVEAARAEEFEYFNSLPVWDIARTQECWDVTGKPPISTKWVDVNKGDQESYDVRSRLVAREMGGGKNNAFYAPTPPLEATRLLFSEAAMCRRTGNNEQKTTICRCPEGVLQRQGRPPDIRRSANGGGSAWILRPAQPIHVRHSTGGYQNGRNLHPGIRTHWLRTRTRVAVLFLPSRRGRRGPAPTTAILARGRRGSRRLLKGV